MTGDPTAPVRLDATVNNVSKIVGPVLLLRASSILIDRDHFLEMLRGLDAEVATISFSMVPIAILMACIALAVVQLDSGSLAAILIRLMAWGGIMKASALIMFPRLVVAKAHVLEQAGFLNVVLATCFLAGAYFTWFGYFASTARRRSAG
jgi:hypothetical protein